MLRGDRGREIDRRPRTLDLPRGAEREVLKVLAGCGVVEVGVFDKRELARLRGKGLVETRKQAIGKRYVEIATLTRQGSLEAKARDFPVRRLNPGRLGDLEHAAGVYHAYRRAEQGIREQGGEVARLIPEEELRRRMGTAREHAKGLFEAEREAHVAAIAKASNIPMVDGKATLPDLQVEWRNRDGVLERMNLEVVTRNYRAGRLGAIGKAGFSTYRTGATVGVRDNSKGGGGDRHRIMSDLMGKS